MNPGREKIVKYILIFLAVMFFFTLIATKVDYMMTAEVMVTEIQKSDLFHTINADGIADGGYVTFETGLEKDGFIIAGQRIALEFSNIRGKIYAIIEEKSFNADTQTIDVLCKIERAEDYTIYDGQACRISFDSVIGSYESVIPRSCVFYEGTNKYVYKIENVRDVLGNKDIVKKLPVEVLDEDDFRAAVSSSLTEQDIIVRVSSKPLKNEQKVRVVE